MSITTNCRKIAVAPMMDWTDRHCRYFMRQISGSVELYTEMVTAEALCHGDVERLLAKDACENPVVLQVGGNDLQKMAKAARLGAEHGYDEININVGCPSDRVQSGAFGACLMARPQVVADCYRAMQSAVDVPVTVKTRIGIDDQDSYDFFRRFVDVVAGAGCRTFIVHARIAVLEGLSPKENRSIPPLNYPRVRKLKTDMPELRIVLNGGITSAAQVREHLEFFDGVMIGRQAYHEPWLLHQLDVQFGSHADPDRRRSDVVRGMYPYIERQLSAGARLNHITRHMLALYAGQPGARAWRRYISEHAHLPGAGVEVLESALGALPAAA